MTLWIRPSWTETHGTLSRWVWLWRTGAGRHHGHTVPFTTGLFECSSNLHVIRHIGGDVEFLILHSFNNLTKKNYTSFYTLGFNYITGSRLIKYWLLIVTQMAKTVKLCCLTLSLVNPFIFCYIWTLIIIFYREACTPFVLACIINIIN